MEKKFPCKRVLWAPQSLPQILIFLKIISFPVNKLSGIETHHRFTTTELETHHRLPQPNIISPQLTIILPQPGRNSPSFYHNRHKKSMKIVRLWRYDGELRCRDGCREKLDENYKKRKLAPDSVDKKPVFRHESCHHWRLPLISHSYFTNSGNWPGFICQYPGLSLIFSTHEV